MNVLSRLLALDRTELEARFLSDLVTSGSAVTICVLFGDHGTRVRRWGLSKHRSRPWGFRHAALLRGRGKLVALMRVLLSVKIPRSGHNHGDAQGVARRGAPPATHHRWLHTQIRAFEHAWGIPTSLAQLVKQFGAFPAGPGGYVQPTEPGVRWVQEKCRKEVINVAFRLRAAFGFSVPSPESLV
jgi:hypothetical protein